MTDTPTPSISMTIHNGDTGKEVALMILAEKGAYYEIRRLLSGAGGYLPDDLDRIRRGIGADRDEWSQVWPAIEHLFPVRDGRRFHQATLDDLQFRDARRSAGKTGGQQPHPTQRPSKSRANVEQTTEQEPSKRRADSRAKVDPPSPSPSPSPSPDPSPTPKPTDPEVGAEAPADGHSPPAPAGVSLLDFCTRGKIRSWALTQPEADRLAEAFPELDIIAVAKKAKAWIAANPKRTPTATGMSAFLYSWVAREQNGRPSRASTTAPARDIRVGRVGAEDCDHSGPVGEVDLGTLR